MFDAFQKSGTEKGAAKRFAASSGIAILAYISVGGTMLVLAGTSKPEDPEEKQVEVKFEKELPKAEPPPPPPPPPKPKKIAAPPPAAPPPGPPPLEAPKEIPKEKPPEADPKPQQLAMVEGDPTARGYGARPGAARGVPGGTGDEEAPEPKKAVYSVLPEDADPPECDLSELTMPTFPEDMRAAGKEGLVILKVIVDSNGRVVKVDVMKGDEPFVGAALAVVKQWTCTPATLDGERITAPKILRIPFKLGVGG